MIQPSGMRFPFKVGANGGISRADGRDKVSSNLHCLVKTGKNQRLVRRDVGTIGYSLLFRKGIGDNAPTVESLVFESIVKYEPRAVGVRVKAFSEWAENGTSQDIIEVSYIFKNTGDPANLRIGV